MRSSARSCRRAQAARLVALAAGTAIAFTAVAKACDMPEFERALRGHGLVPPPILAYVARLVVGLELAVAVAVMRVAAALGRVQRPLMLLAGLWLLFTAYALALTLSPPGQAVGCGCGWSYAPGESWVGICLRNCGGTLVFWGLAVMGARWERDTRTEVAGFPGGGVNHGPAGPPAPATRSR
jgi:hypothetical protein